MRDFSYKKCSKWVILVAKTKEGSLDDQKKIKQKNKKITPKMRTH